MHENTNTQDNFFWQELVNGYIIQLKRYNFRWNLKRNIQVSRFCLKFLPKIFVYLLLHTQQSKPHTHMHITGNNLRNHLWWINREINMGSN